jgi:hypothetical protein
MYYDTEKKIPIDSHWVARRLRLDAKVIEDVLTDMFEKHEDGWFHARCHEVIGQYHAMAEKNRMQMVSWVVGKRTQWVSQWLPTRNPSLRQLINQELITNNQLNTNICPPEGEPEEKLPDCEHKAVISLYHQHLPTLRKVEVWNTTRHGYLRQRWREVAIELSQGKTIQTDDVLNWWADFFKHIAYSKFLTGKVNSKDGRAFTADLEWILKPSNFAKIVEGKYHGTN